jgi:cyclase
MRIWTFILLLVASVAGAQERDYRYYFQQGEEAAKKKDYRAYVDNVAKALELNTARPNRPWYMYHLARGHAFLGDEKQAVVWLENLWNDGVESLMISYVDLDPVFAETRKTPEYAALMKRVSEMKVAITPIAGTVFHLDGAGCNLVASIGPDGVLLVDSGYEKAAPAIRRALESKPVRFIVNTHAHEDHVAGNAYLGEKATVLAHPNARAEMMKENPLIEGEVIVPPKSAKYLPNVLVDSPVTIHLNGEDVRIVPVPSHTNNDLVVWFPASKVLHMGDNYFPGVTKFLYPGENLKAYFAALDPLLASVPDDAYVVSGHQPTVRGKELKEMYAATVELRDFVAERKKKGSALEAVQAEGAGRLYSPGWVKYYYEHLD